MSELDQILAAEQIHSLFQPIVDLDTDAIVGYEALARGPVGDLQRPDLLFAAAAAAGLLTELDAMCQRAALHGAIATGIFAPLTLFINVEPEVVHPAQLEGLLAIARNCPTSSPEAGGIDAIGKCEGGTATRASHLRHHGEPGRSEPARSARSRSDVAFGHSQAWYHPTGSVNVWSHTAKPPSTCRPITYTARKEQVGRLLGGEDVEVVLGEAVACLVTRDEHARITPFDGTMRGWARYEATGFQCGRHGEAEPGCSRALEVLRCEALAGARPYPGVKSVRQRR